MLRAINSWRRMVEERQMMMKVTPARALPAPAFPSPLIFPLPMLSSPQLEQQEAQPSSRVPAPLSQDLTPRSPLQAAMAIANRGLRFGLNAWVETAAELSRRRALVRSMTPAARAMRRALNSWCARVDGRRQLLNATAALRHREVFVALQAYLAAVRQCSMAKVPPRYRLGRR